MSWALHLWPGRAYFAMPKVLNFFIMSSLSSFDFLLAIQAYFQLMKLDG